MSELRREHAPPIAADRDDGQCGATSRPRRRAAHRHFVQRAHESRPRAGSDVRAQARPCPPPRARSRLGAHQALPQRSTPSRPAGRPCGMRQGVRSGLAPTAPRGGAARQRPRSPVRSAGVDRRRGCGTTAIAHAPRRRLRLDGVPDRDREIGAAEPLDRADAGRRGDVDLGEMAVDHVDADEEQPALAAARADASRRSRARARVSSVVLRRAAAHHVGADVVACGHAVDRARATRRRPG